MVHSTGCEQTRISAYTNNWNSEDSGVSVHAFIGKDDDGEFAVVQTLPWDARAWHCGRDKNGSANNTHISFEICEDDLTDQQYFNTVYGMAVELSAMLCKTYDIDPMTGIICHSEGHAAGIASNHADVMHWFPKHGKNMDIFRKDVMKAMKFEEAHPVHAEAWKKACEKGIMDGTRPAEPVTRQQLATILERLKLI